MLFNCLGIPSVLLKHSNKLEQAVVCVKAAIHIYQVSVNIHKSSASRKCNCQNFYLHSLQKHGDRGIQLCYVHTLLSCIYQEVGS